MANDDDVDMYLLFTVLESIVSRVLIKMLMASELLDDWRWGTEVCAYPIVAVSFDYRFECVCVMSALE